MSIHRYLSSQVKQALQQAQEAGELPAFDIPEVKIEEPRQKNYGDYATPAPLELARHAQMAPTKIAEAAAKYLTNLNYVDQVQVASPGFINFHLANTWLQQLVVRILTEGDEFGCIDLGRGKKGSSGIR